MLSQQALLVPKQLLSNDRLCENVHVEIQWIQLEIKEHW